MQGDPSSPIIFNIVVDVVLRAVLAEVCGPQEAHRGLVLAAVNGVFFYTRMMFR